MAATRFQGVDHSTSQLSPSVRPNFILRGEAALVTQKRTQSRKRHKRQPRPPRGSEKTGRISITTSRSDAVQPEQSKKKTRSRTTTTPQHKGRDFGASRTAQGPFLELTAFELFLFFFSSTFESLWANNPEFFDHSSCETPRAINGINAPCIRI